MSDSCQIHAEFMHFQWFWDLVLNWKFFQDFGASLVGERLVLNSCRIHAEFMLISFLPWSFTTLCATFCITLVLNSCWVHAEFKQNREKYLNLPIKWHLKHLTGLLMLYTIRNTVWDFSKNCWTCKNHIFSRNCLNSAWIQHEFNMNSTPLLCKVLHKALWKLRWRWNQHEISMNSAWIRHEFDMNSTPVWFYHAFLVMVNYKLS